MNFGIQRGDLVKVIVRMSDVFKKDSMAVISYTDELGNFSLKQMIGDYRQRFTCDYLRHIKPLGIHLDVDNV